MKFEKLHSVKIQAIAVFLFTGSVLFSRLELGHRGLFKESLWAEDGLFALCNIKASPSSCFFNSFSGYWSGLPRLNAFLVSRFSISDWAIINNSLTLLFLSSVAGFSFLMIREGFKNKFIPLLLVLAPTFLAGLSHEVLLVSNSIFGILGYFILAIYLYSNFCNLRVGIKFWIFVGFAVIYTLSNPLAFLLLIIVVVDQAYFKNVSRNHKILTSFLVISNGIQGIYVLLNHSERHQAELGLGFIKSFVFEFIKSFSLLMYSPTDINYLSKRNFQTIFFLTVLIVSLLSTTYFVLKNFRNVVKKVLLSSQLLFPLFVLIASVFISVLTNGAASRFEVMTSLYALIFLVGVVTKLEFTYSRTAFVALSLGILINSFYHFSASELRATGPLWSQQIASVREFCVRNPKGSTHFVFAPNWTASIQHPYKIQEPTTEKIDCALLNLVK